MYIPSGRFRRSSLSERKFFVSHNNLRKTSKSHDKDSITEPSTRSVSLDQQSPLISDRNKFLKLNVGGTSYRFLEETLINSNRVDFLHNFVLANHALRLNICDGFIEESDEYFFQRSSHTFHSIYEYFISGQCHKPMDICLELFSIELNFWGLSDAFLSKCCWPEPAGSSINSEDAESATDGFEKIYLGTFRRKIWNLLEVPDYSFLARIISIISIVAVLASNTGLILASTKYFQVDKYNSHMAGNVTQFSMIKEPHRFLDYLEYVCIAWFTMEYITKMTVAYNRRVACLQMMNVIDLVAILPFYVELTLDMMGLDTAKLQEFQGALLVLRILRVLRVIRLFKLGRYSTGIKAFAKTLDRSKEQLGMLVVVLCIGVMFFSTLVYYLEKDVKDTKFESIPAGFWWCIVTMTTVGYGDMFPETILGKLVASSCIACGILVLALPITIIVDNFMQVQEDMRLRQPGQPSIFAKPQETKAN